MSDKMIGKWVYGQDFDDKYDKVSFKTVEEASAGFFKRYGMDAAGSVAQVKDCDDISALAVESENIWDTITASVDNTIEHCSFSEAVDHSENTDASKCLKREVTASIRKYLKKIGGPTKYYYMDNHGEIYIEDGVIVLDGSDLEDSVNTEITEPLISQFKKQATAVEEIWG